MTRWSIGALLFFILFLLAACRQSPQPVPTPVSPIDPATNPVLLPALEELEMTWNVLLPGEETACALGDPFGFFVRPADPEHLLLYFQGGGACWNSITCSPGETATYDPSVTRDDNPSRNQSGVFDLSNPANPFADYSIVVIPGCTADAHLGYRAVSYETPAGSEFSIYHGGFGNATAVLEWVYENFSAPGSVFVAGSGMAAISTPLFAYQVAEHFPDARIVQMADGGGGFHGDTDEFEEILRIWGTQELLSGQPHLEQEPGDAFSPVDLYLNRLAAEGRIQFSHYNTVADADQVFFTRLAGASGKFLLERIDANHAVILAAVPKFASFTAPGEGSGILWSNDLYSLVVDGSSFQQWLAALAQGEVVKSVRCPECVVPEGAP